MKLSDILTAASVENFNRLHADATTTGQDMMADYRKLREESLAEYPALDRWVTSMEQFRFAEAAAPALLQSLYNDGFIRLPQHDRSEASAVIDYEFISPRFLDAFRPSGEPSTQYAFTTAKFCCRREDLPKDSPLRGDLVDPCLVNCEVFELPMGVTRDTFDDREKIHVIYLVGNRKGQLDVTPLYVGIGTGEAFGTGPRHHPGLGRFRFFRYDAKDNMHCEFIRCEVTREWTERDVRHLVDVTRISETSATLLLGKSIADQSYMCLSDPIVQPHYQKWFSDHPENVMDFIELNLSKDRQTLPCDSPRFPKITVDLGALLHHAEEVYRHYVVAWMHPARLTAEDAIRIYYRQLPAFRREQYEVYRLRSDIFTPALVDEGAVTIPGVLTDPALKRRVTPETVASLERWWRPQIVKDLYAYGNHPELRLCIGLLACRLLTRSGIWMEAIHAAFRRRLFDLDGSVERLIKQQ